MKEIEKKLIQITKAIKENNCMVDGLFIGHSGIAIFQAYINQLYNDPGLNSEMEISLQKSIESFAQEESTYTFSNGFAGICWGINHLAKQNKIDTDINSLFEEIHPLLISTSSNDLKVNFYDFLHGGLGACVYFLDLLPNQMAKDHLTKTINLLFEHALIKEGDVVWNNVHLKMNKKSNNEINLGLSHGIPSIIWFLTKCYEHKIEEEKCFFLINGAIKWITRQKLFTQSLSLYPTSIEDSIPIKNSRLGWCYGDLGIASVLWQAGKALSNEEFKNEALNIMLHASLRKNLKEKENITNDAGICHGTSGIAHIFNRFYWETRSPVFKETANYWIEETLKMAYHKDGLAGYKSWNGKDTGWLNNYGLLEGIAGIGLVLYSHLSDEEPKWDRCLLLS